MAERGEAGEEELEKTRTVGTEEETRSEGGYESMREGVREERAIENGG